MNKATIIIAAMAAVWQTAASQDLRTEITVERTVVPRERAATRIPSALPVISAPALSPVRLNAADYTTPSRLTPSLVLLSPARYGDTVAVSPYRGYAALGYFPVFNLGASAGYRLIDRRSTTLGAWMQYDGNSYHDTFTTHDGIKPSYRNHNVAVGADLSVRMARNSELGVNAAYRMESTHLPRHYNPSESYDRTVHMADVAARWSSRPSSLAYSVGARYGYFGYAGANNENSLEVNASLAVCGEGRPHLGIDARYSLANSGCPIYNNPGAADGATSASQTLGVASLTPFYNARFGRVSARIGVKLDISTGGTGKKLHVAPDVRLSWEPSSRFAIYAVAGGGEHLNDLRSLYAENRYMYPGQGYQRSHVPLTIDAGFNIGPVAGVTIGVFGGYAIANDWLMPLVSMHDIDTYTDFSYTNVRGWHGGISAEWTFRSLFTLSARGEAATNGNGTKAYYLWRDRAECRVDLGLKVHPTDRLDIEAGYRFSGKRRSALASPHDSGLTIALGNISDLRVGAAYRVSDALSVFLRGENLLDHRYSIVHGVTSQGVHGLAGVELKF